MKHRNHEVEISPCSHFCFFKVFVPKIMQFSIPKTSVFSLEFFMHDCVSLTLSQSLLLSCDLWWAVALSSFEIFIRWGRQNRLRFGFDEHPVFCHFCCSAFKFTGILCAERKLSFWTSRRVNFKASARIVWLFFSWLPTFPFSRKKKLHPLHAYKYRYCCLMNILGCQ